MLLDDVGGIAWGNRWWMSWNALLALLPALFAVHLFRPHRAPGPLWTIELVAFVLFLPNAPYVVTDLVHLRSDVVVAGSDAAVYAGVLPLYGAFIALGFGAYAISLHELAGWLRRSGRPHLVGRAQMGLHALCAVGVLLGRVARLNSWDTLTEPHGTIERALGTLSWRGAPIALVVLFLVIWLGHAVTRALAEAAATWATEHAPARVRPAPNP
jgi:uncharacterized membrane protein